MDIPSYYANERTTIAVLFMFLICSTFTGCFFSGLLYTYSPHIIDSPLIGTWQKSVPGDSVVLSGQGGDLYQMIFLENGTLKQMDFELDTVDIRHYNLRRDSVYEKDIMEIIYDDIGIGYTYDFLGENKICFKRYFHLLLDSIRYDWTPCFMMERVP